MPEGDSLFRFAARLRTALVDKRIQSAQAQGPGAVPRVERIVGATCTAVRSQGKNLLISFDNGLALRGHLRMYGTWHVYRPGQSWLRPRGEARLVLEVVDAVVVNFSAPVIELLEERAVDLHKPLRELGPDLLDDDFDLTEALRRLREPGRATVTIGDAVMDQRVMAGVGNIWKHETLFRVGVNPWRTVGELDDATLHALVEMAQALLRASVGKLNRLDLRSRPTMYAYGRAGQPCLRCRTRLRAATQGIDIRRTAWCPVCQPEAEGQRVHPRVRNLSQDSK